ncbi:MAG: RagB/SusD family nutrient uptake outer membrane protein, partial [Tidjanibacter sp.]|nr:RagB/SusD family nutrient uptake outer membrane protein [Tidjanibacter sp.]
MKKILNISLIALLAMAMVSCEMDYFRSDTMTSAQLEADPGAAVYTTDGNYSMFKDCLLYNGSTYSGNTYVRHYFQMSEFRGDNMTLSGRTTDPLYEAYTYTDNSTLRNNNYYWFVAYKIIYGANSNIGAIPTGASTESDHMKGENLFMRAIAHFHLVTLYAKPYSCGRDNMGVVLRTSTDCSVTERATVGEVYDQVVADLTEAAALMKNGSRRGDAGYIGYEAAMALLSRVYLYMGENDKVLEITNQLLGSNPAANLDTDLRNIFVNARSSKETLWCVAHTAVETQERGSIGSMYYSPDGTGGTGWCEIYWSDPLMELFLRHPEDK